jgi:hypothetical protein
VRRPLYRYSVTTFDPRAAWWCGHFRKWGGGDDLGCWRYRRCLHRSFRTLKQAKTQAAVLLLRGIVDVVVLESGRERREWLLASTKPSEGADAAPSIAWARAYLALPRRKR